MQEEGWVRQARSLFLHRTRQEGRVQACDPGWWVVVLRVSESSLQITSVLV